jgi:methyl halide transferase
MRTLVEEGIAPGRAVELGCGTGTNAVWLAAAGFDVTGLDLSSTAVARAQARAEAAGTAARFLVADLLDPLPVEGPFDFVFDRGCYHVLRGVDVDRFLEGVANLVGPSTAGLFLTGNAREPSGGPPVVSEAELRDELGRLFEIVRLREFRFDIHFGPIDGPLGWSCFVRRPAAGGAAPDGV